MKTVDEFVKAVWHCSKGECNNCPNIEELGSGEIVCTSRLLTDLLPVLVDLHYNNKVLKEALGLACAEITGETGFCCYKDSDCDRTILTCDECMEEYFINKAKIKIEDKI